MKKITSTMRCTINDYNMIQKGDSIAVGVSGGKDSLTLLAAMATLCKYHDKSFSLKAITIDMGFEGVSTDGIAGFCNSLGIEYIVQKIPLAKILFDVRKEKNPCSLCARLRRGALHNIAIENGCRKIALGHHLDDVIETFFLSLFFEGRIHCFRPVTYLDRKDVTLIRPLIYVEEKEIQNYARRAVLPVLHNPCPANGNTKREYVKRLISDLERDNKAIRRTVFGAVKAGLLNKAENVTDII